MSRHPIQPLERDGQGTLRFKANEIVRYLLDHGGIDLNALACLPFSAEDRQQFAQLIGYSLSGYGDLSYVDDDAYRAAETMFERGVTAEQARAETAEGELLALRLALREPVARLFGIHPEDLGAEEDS